MTFLHNWLFEADRKLVSFDYLAWFMEFLGLRRLWRGQRRRATASLQQKVIQAVGCLFSMR